MKYSNSDIIEKQRLVFISFMEEVAKTYGRRKIINYSRDDIKSLRIRINNFLNEEKQTDEENVKTIGFTTLKGYVEICQDTNKELKYREYVLNLCAKYIKVFPKYKDFRNYVERSKDLLKLSDFATNDLIYSPKKKTDEINKNVNSFDYEEMSYELLSNLDDDEVNLYIKYYQTETDDLKINEEANFWLGILQLQKKEYFLSIQYFKKCIDLNPINDEYHYNLALAKFKGRHPSRLSNKEIKDIEVDLMNAFNLNPNKRKFYELKYIIQEVFYKGDVDQDDKIDLEDIEREQKREQKRMLNILQLQNFFNQ